MNTTTAHAKIVADKKEGGKMAHFYGELHGHLGIASRIGNKNTGIGSVVRGTSVGIYVEGRYNKDGNDVFIIHVTDGKKASMCVPIASVIEKNGEITTTIFEHEKEGE